MSLAALPRRCVVQTTKACLTSQTWINCRAEALKWLGDWACRGKVWYAYGEIDEPSCGFHGTPTGRSQCRRQLRGNIHVQSNLQRLLNSWPESRKIERRLTWKRSSASLKALLSSKAFQAELLLLRGRIASEPWGLCDVPKPPDRDPCRSRWAWFRWHCAGSIPSLRSKIQATMLDTIAAFVECMGQSMSVSILDSA